jgi:hypothetical protein
MHTCCHLLVQALSAPKTGEKIIWQNPAGSLCSASGSDMEPATWRKPRDIGRDCRTDGAEGATAPETLRQRDRYRM